jgi:hypothetical protein
MSELFGPLGRIGAWLDSPPIFQRAVETADGAVPGSRVVLLPGQQHIAMNTNPALFVGEVLDFLLD